MRFLAFLVVLMTCTLAGVGCSTKSRDTAIDAHVGTQSGAAPAATDDPEMPSSVQYDRNAPNRSMRFPREESVGMWTSEGQPGKWIEFTDIEFRPRAPLPSEGYVPVVAMGHTLSVHLRNGTDKYLANIEIDVTAFDRATKKQIAVLRTGSVLPYFLVPPNTTVKRTVELTFGTNGEENSPFAEVDAWAEFDVSIDVVKARLIEELEAG